MKNLKSFYFPLLFAIIIILVNFILKPSQQYGCKSSFTNNINSKDELTFFITSDIHYLSKSLYDNGDAFKRFNNS